MGSGFRVWTAGEVVSASNVNNYLQEQAVMSFGGTAARSSAVASPEEGMLSYLQDTDTYQGYDGSAWVNLGTLSGASDSGLVHIETVTIGATVSAINVNDVFTSAYTNYKVIFNLDASTNTNNATLTLRMRVSGSDDSTNNYNRRGYGITTTLTSLSDTSTQFSFMAITSGSTNRTNSNLEFRAPAIAKPTFIYSSTLALASGSLDGSNIAMQHNVSTAYDGFSIIVSTGSITGGKIVIYGYKE